MSKHNLEQFLAAARQYLFGLVPQQPVLATIPVRRSH